jgi:AraC-like DNA-binding protein
MNIYNIQENTNALLQPIIHADDFFEIVLFEKAKGSLELNGQTVTIQDNSVFFIAPFQKKSYSIETLKAKGINLVFQDKFFSDLFDDSHFAYRMQYFYNAQHPQFLHLSSDDFNFIKTILNEVAKELAELKNGSKQIIKSLLYFVLMKLNRLFSKRYKLPSTTHGDSLIYKFKEALERNIRKFHLVDDYCDILSIQRHKLNRIIKTHFGNTVKETIHFRLLKEIKLELMYSDKTISEIARELNFSEANNLTRFFNRLEGVPPTLFREKNQNDRE